MSMMKNEVRTACRFLSMILKRSRKVSDRRLEVFTTKMEELLCERYRHHWHPQTPLLGSGFRCIRINHTMDPLIAAAAHASGVSSEQLSAFPEELTLWVDPNEVCFRIGENGSICDIDENVFNDLKPRKESTTSYSPKAKARTQEKSRSKESMLHSNRDIIPVQTLVSC
jgi:protein Tob/BTG